jgi:hypothetical protein
VAQANFVFGWAWILAGFASGALLGSKFHDEQWLGGYASHRRRLLRLGHISFFGLAAVNLLFFFSARHLAPAGPTLAAASALFLVGGTTMPACCVAMAFAPKLKPLFALPVASLIVAAALTLFEAVSR